MSAAWYAKFAIANRTSPIAAASVTAIRAVATTVIAVKTRRYGSRRPPRSLTAPRIGDTIALSSTLAAAARPNQNCPSAGPRRSIVHRPIAYDTTEYVKIVLARSYKAQATGTTARPLGVRAA